MAILIFFSSLFLSCILRIPAEAQKVDSADIQAISGRLRELLSPNFPNPDSVLSWMKSMQPNGSWSHIDYYSTRVSSWPAIQHLGRVTGFANAYSNKASPLYKNEKLAKALHLSLDFWLRHNFTDLNWWWADIGVPQTLTNILILMDGTFTHEELVRAVNQMRGSYISQTGQNRVWRAEIQLKIGLLEYGRGMETTYLGDPGERIKNAIGIIQEGVVVQHEWDGEGIQPDWSFHQHGIQQQLGNYGLSFASIQTDWAWVLKDSPFHYDPQKTAILRNYVLNGLSSIDWHGKIDISACGRQLYSGLRELKGEQIIAILKRMAEVDPDHAPEYSACIHTLKGERTPSSVPARNIYFWNSDLMIQRTQDHYISVRMHSKVIQSTESGAGDNLSGAYLADGATYLYQSGEEYKDIFPIWNWRRIPGITSDVQKPLPKVVWGGLPNESDFVGGISDSSIGVAAMLFKRDGLTAYKSWFFGPDGLVCLGAGIHSDQNTDIATTVNQSLLTGKITVKTNKGEKILSAGSPAITGKVINWVYHDHTGYIFLQKNVIHVSADVQTGRWNQVYNEGSPEPVTGSVFNLWIDHGSSPVNQSYAYRVLPNIDIKSLSQIVHHPTLEIVENDTLLQVIRYPANGIVQAIFYHAGRINLSQHTVLQADNPCILMAEPFKGGLKLILSVPPENGEGVELDANGFPEKKEVKQELAVEQKKNITLTLSGHYEGEGCSYESGSNQTKIVWGLPTGIYSGKSTSKVLTLR